METSDGMRASPRLGIGNASTAALATSSIPSLAAFVHPGNHATPSRASTKRWKVVSPSPAKRSHREINTKTLHAKKKPKGPSTRSFDAVTADSFPSLEGANIEIHTLVLGTHPSIKSLEESQYFGHPMNKGFALWDIVQSCDRPGSLDQDITDDEPNDIREFCGAHPSIRRIVFANGGTGCKFFKKHFKDWLDTGELIPSSNKASQDAFKKWAVKSASNTNAIECIVALAVSPAAARFSYEEKRDFWEKFVYAPGLKDFEKSQTPD
eukprot:scaffold338_cov116-Cylindrotheca_fusiformis.AAC.8